MGRAATSSSSSGAGGEVVAEVVGRQPDPPGRRSGRFRPTGHSARSSPTLARPGRAEPGEVDPPGLVAGRAGLESGRGDGEDRPRRGLPTRRPGPARRRPRRPPSPARPARGAGRPPRRTGPGPRTGRGRSNPGPGPASPESGSNTEATNRANVASSSPMSGPPGRVEPGPSRIKARPPGSAGSSRGRPPRPPSGPSPRGPWDGSAGKSRCRRGRPGGRAGPAPRPIASGESAAGRPGKVPSKATSTQAVAPRRARTRSSRSSRSGPVESSSACPWRPSSATDRPALRAGPRVEAPQWAR